MPTDHVKAVCKLLRAGQPQHDLYTLFSDCMETAAIAISNAVDLRHREAREARYMDIVKRYDRPIIENFAKVLSHVVLALEEKCADVLGSVFGELELGNAARGQFFTPYTVCTFMAEAALGNADEARALIERHGFVSAMEPACGAGGMIIALAQAMHRHGINEQRHLHVTAVDIDRRAVHMTYIQLALLHIPAVVIADDSLSLEMQDFWYTPAHILGGWNAKLAARRVDPEATPTEIVEVATSPLAVRPPVAIDATARPSKPQQLTLF